MVGLPKHDLMRAARSLYYSRAMIVPVDKRLTPQALVDLFIPQPYLIVSLSSPMSATHWLFQLSRRQSLSSHCGPWVHDEHLLLSYQIVTTFTAGLSRWFPQERWERRDPAGRTSTDVPANLGEEDTLLCRVNTDALLFILLSYGYCHKTRSYLLH